MTHHLLPEVERDWLNCLTNCFLIRDPAEVIASYVKKNDDPELEDLGFVQQAEIFEWVRERSETIPAVIDARDVLQDPERLLRLLCRAVGVEFDPAMLSWPPGLARDGRYLGETLVRRGGKFDRVRTLSRAACGGTEAITPDRSAMPGILRRAFPTPLALRPKCGEPPLRR